MRLLMRFLMLPVALATAVALAGCGRATLPVGLPAPVDLADRTTIDERAALGVEVAYRAAGVLLERAIDQGRLRGGAAVRANTIDANVAHYVGVARAAYDAGNARGYAEAAKIAAPMIAELRALAGAD